jgi:hexosaminidase
MAHRGSPTTGRAARCPTWISSSREIRTLAAYKLNTFSPYFEHTFAYASTPVAAFPGGSMTPAEARELVEYAAQYHITVIPEQEAFGHLHNVLKFEQYSPWAKPRMAPCSRPATPGRAPDCHMVRRAGAGLSRPLRAHRRR